MKSLSSLAVVVVFAGCSTLPPAPGDDAGVVEDGGAEDAGVVVDAGRCDIPASTEAGVITTATGTVRGVLENSVWAFRGIPFAEPPVGELRFRAPEPTCWSGVRDAGTFGAMCTQVNFLDDGGSELVGQEDCLTLNVWSPADAGASAKPVLFFIHGGGNQSGSTSGNRGGVVLYEGGALAGHEDAVVVTTQYRLGPLGFMARASLQNDAGVGNYGLLDQQAALRWVRDNIAAFGGDPTHVMVFGESAGALDTCSQLASPGAAGLFAAAGVESGACIADTTANRFTQAEPFVMRAGCLGASDEAACLRSVDAGVLMQGLDPIFSEGFVTPLWGATIDGVTLVEHPLEALRAGRGNRVPTLVGSNADEASITSPTVVTPAMVSALFDRFQEPLKSQLLALYPPGMTNMEARRSYIAAATDSQFTCNARRLARAVSPFQPTFRYFFDHHLPGAQGTYLGAFHGVELFYVFRALERSPLAAQATVGDRFVIDYTGASWSSLARTGDVNGQGRTPWPRSTGNDQLMIISPTPMAQNGIREAECNVWDQLRP
ncbi:MAG: carboxylesterase family protein [Archangium sp.]